MWHFRLRSKLEKLVYLQWGTERSATKPHRGSGLLPHHRGERRVQVCLRFHHRRQSGETDALRRLLNELQLEGMNRVVGHQNGDASRLRNQLMQEFHVLYGHRHAEISNTRDVASR